MREECAKPIIHIGRVESRRHRCLCMGEAGDCKHRAKYVVLSLCEVFWYLLYVSFLDVHLTIFLRDSFFPSVSLVSSTTLSAALQQTACESISVLLRSFFKCPSLRLSQQAQNAPFEGAHAHRRALRSLARPHPKVTLLTASLYVSSRRGGTSSPTKALPVPTLSTPSAFPSTDSIGHCYPFHCQWIVNVFLFSSLGHMCLPAWDLFRFGDEIQKSVFLIFLYLFKMKKNITRSPRSALHNQSFTDEQVD